MAGSLKVNISSDETTAVVQADSTTQGALLPRMTSTQRDAISSPATGLLIWNTTTAQLEEYTGAAWGAVGAGTTTTLDAGDITYTPAVDTDWDSDTDPGDLDDALDQLAERVDDLEAASPSTTGEIFLSAAGMWPSTTSGCATNTKNEYGTNDVDMYSLDFDASTDEYAQATVWMPDDWNAGTVTAKFMWTAASSSGDVVWGLQGISYANDDAIDSAWGTAQTATDTLTATGDICITSATSAITLAGTPAAGEPVQLRVYRDADAGGDTLAADAMLLGVKIYYTRS